MNNLTSDIEHLLGGNLPLSDSLAVAPAEMKKARIQIDHYRKALMNSRTAGRHRPHTLIVEDQAFSRKLLYEVLHDDCSVSVCTNAIDGWRLYVEEVPDIVFLDIGL